MPGNPDRVRIELRERDRFTGFGDDHSRFVRGDRDISSGVHDHSKVGSRVRM
jgi:hypothetical protein